MLIKKILLVNRIQSIVILIVVSIAVFVDVNLKASSNFENNNIEILYNDSIYESMESALSNPELVFHLNLSNKKLTELPIGLEKLVNLKELDLSNNMLTKLNTKLTELEHLESLLLENNQFYEFPSEVIEVKNLKNLNLSDNKINFIPKELWTTKLQTFLFANNLIEIAPKEFWEMESLIKHQSEFGKFKFGVLSENCRVFNYENKLGIMDSTGNIILQTNYYCSDYLIPKFENGSCLVLLKDEDSYYAKIGIIDKKGNLVVKTNYLFEEATCNNYLEFKCGYFPVLEIKEGKESETRIWKFMKPSGKIIFDTKLETGSCTAACWFMPEYSENLCAIGNGSSFGYMDLSGKICIPMKFKSAGNFSEGLACVMMEEKKGRYYYTFINKKGEMAMNKKFYFYCEDESSALYFYGCSSKYFRFKNGLCELEIYPNNGDINQPKKVIINTKGEIVSN